MIRLFTINCSDDDNIEVCRRAGVTQFPQVRFYWVMSNSLYQDGQRLRILGKSVHAMRHMITDKVIESYVEHNKILADKRKQPNQHPLVGFAQSLNSVAQTGNSGALNSLMKPFLGQLLGGTSSEVTKIEPGSGGSGLAGIMSALTGLKSASSGNPISSLVSIMGGLSGITQVLSNLSSRSGGFLSQRLSVQPLPNNWPELEAIMVISTQQLLDMLPLDTTKNIGALLIMETQEFLYTGLEVMLDLNIYSNQTYIARVTDENSRLTKNLTMRSDIVAPALIYVTPTREIKLIISAPKFTNDEDLRRLFVKAYDKLKAKYHLRRTFSSGRVPSAGEEVALSQEDEDILARASKVYKNDLINTIRASLMEQVFRHPDLSDDQHNALVKYVYILINYYPFEEKSLKFFRRLHSWLQNQVSPIDVGEYKKQFYDIDEVFAPSEWIACKSLSNIKSIQANTKRTPSLFENPAQLGKMVSNITRILRNHNPVHLKNLFNLFSSSMSPVMLNQNQKQSQRKNESKIAPVKLDRDGETSTQKPAAKKEQQSESTIERLVKSLMSGSLGSDSSILKLISTALTGGSGSSDKNSPALGKSKFAREYSCGAWKLAHTLVVSEYIKDSQRRDVKHIVLPALYQYLLHFYACSTCGNRVSDVSKEFRLNLDDHLLDQGDSVMLLWKVHNRVNKRLEVEFRPGSPEKVQFPSESLCPRCRAAKDPSDISSTPNWLEKNILPFIVHQYQNTSLIYLANSSDASSSLGSLHLTGSSHLHLTMAITLTLVLCLNRLLVSQTFFV